jgi:thiamine-phosphate pyrophosphorylase
MHKLQIDYSLYLVTDRDLLDGKDFFESIEQAIKGGVSLVQLREKALSSKEFLQLAIKLKEITSRHHIPLIINDRLDIALAVDADGLHIGQEDLPLLTARKFLGQDKIIGVSATTLAEALLAEKQGADYLGVGAIFATPTKTDAKLVTLEELKLIKSSVNIPVVAIGGIKEANTQTVMPTGIDGVSVVSAVLAKDDPKEAAIALKKLINKYS